jgi:RNA 2',3'-cyclic 3'-phosphodiesterase
MPERTRTFIAIAVPKAVEPKLARLQSDLAEALPECRWTRAMPFHLTLAFLGDIPSNLVNEVCTAVASSTRTIEPFEIEVAGLGAFPSLIRPRVIWAGVTACNQEKLIDLQGSVVNALAGIGQKPDDQRFHPHVTLGRIKPGRHGRPDLNRLMQSPPDGWASRWLVKDVQVFASTLGPAGSAYEVLARSNLGGKKTEDRA